eukprot:NODE_2820_length_445_cov_83.952020_g2338_i0.p1 GENE.NODE_2820_length_445_cov_83.952020_g2338_i0~~NODE_2820_length_445_cov_83.952020_g2338_i0.p1  ORF type:complete len:79 (-),score=27.38 NODE_2820_length_445_cov_83.952020_g2338_i0:207-419(-)
MGGMSHYIHPQLKSLGGTDMYFHITVPEAAAQPRKTPEDGTKQGDACQRNPEKTAERCPPAVPARAVDHL